MASRGRALFVALAASVLVLDQASKALMTSWLAPRGRVEVIPGLFDLTYVLNTGAVFGLFRSLDGAWRGLILTLVPLAAMALVLALAARTPAHRLAPLSALGLILGGAVGNLLDRLRLGAVVDFLDIYIGRHHWPAFNVADSAICIGVGVLLIEMWRPPPPRGTGEEP
jgi:signal peptidase II